MDYVRCKKEMKERVIHKLANSDGFFCTFFHVFLFFYFCCVYAYFQTESWGWFFILCSLFLTRVQRHVGYTGKLAFCSANPRVEVKKVFRGEIIHEGAPAFWVTKNKRKKKSDENKWWLKKANMPGWRGNYLLLHMCILSLAKFEARVRMTIKF